MKTRLNKPKEWTETKPTTKAKWYKCVRVNTNAIWQQGEHATHQLVSKQVNSSHTIVSQTSLPPVTRKLVDEPIGSLPCLKNYLNQAPNWNIFQFSVKSQANGPLPEKMRRWSKRTRQKKKKHSREIKRQPTDSRQGSEKEQADWQL